MNRAIVPVFTFALFASGTAWAVPSFSCMTPSEKYTYRTLQALPRPVVEAAMKRFPDLRPTMADCQKPVAEADVRRFSCFYIGASYGNRWVVAASRPGANAVRAAAVFFFEEGLDVREMVAGESGISTCAINLIAGIRPKPVRPQFSPAGARPGQPPLPSSPQR